MAEVLRGIEMATKRNYVRERKTETKARKEQRKARGRARTAMGLKVGDSRTVQHKKPLSKGGSNGKGNLSTTSNKKNSSQGGKMGSKVGKARGGRAAARSRSKR